MTLPVPAEYLTEIVSVRRATPTTRIMRVRFTGPAFDFEAGQAAAIGPPTATLRVPYSIACAPEDTRADGVVEFLVKSDAPEKWGPTQPPFRHGMALAIQGPYGTFVFPAHPAERRFLFVAGGTGIAPLRSMIRRARASGHAGSLHLAYSARARDEFAYLEEFRGLARRAELSLTLNLTRDIRPGWRGSRGRVDEAQLATLLRDGPTLCFVCGPASMVEDVAMMLEKLGTPPDRIRVPQW